MKGKINLAFSKRAFLGGGDGKGQVTLEREGMT